MLEADQVELNYLTSDISEFMVAQRGMDDEQVPLAFLYDMKQLFNSFLLSSLYAGLDILSFLSTYFGEKAFKVIKESNPSFDHVGLELFGSVEKYKTLIQEHIVRGYTKFKLFQSVQAYQVLKEEDESLKQVDIMRVFPKNGHEVELFTYYQTYRTTSARETMEHTHFPLSHIAIRLRDTDALMKFADTIAPNKDFVFFGKGVYYNPSDNSSNIKFRFKNDIPILGNQVLEFVSY